VADETTTTLTQLALSAPGGIVLVKMIVDWALARAERAEAAKKKAEEEVGEVKEREESAATKKLEEVLAVVTKLQQDFAVFASTFAQHQRATDDKFGDQADAIRKVDGRVSELDPRLARVERDIVEIRTLMSRPRRTR
jgi:hypothetical protein